MTVLFYVEKYVLHCRNLKLFLSLGLEMEKDILILRIYNSGHSSYALLEI